MFELDWFSRVDPAATEAELVARLGQLELVKSAAAAGQARAAAALDAARRAAESAAGVPAAKRGRGVASEVALARHDSPARGGRHLGLAKALVHEMPCTLAALEQGALTEWRATLIVRESACLDLEDRRELDRELCAAADQLAGWGDKRITAAAQKIAYRLDAQAVVDRAAHAVEDRTVTIRPAPDNMTRVNALLPLAQGVGVYAALRRAADTTSDGRTRGQVMADTLVERITATPATTAASIALNVVISDRALLGNDNDPATVEGYGPIPAEVARRWLTAAHADATALTSLRRLYANPTTGALVAMESRARPFPRALAEFINLRDQTCRTPYCDAPIRHRDHITPVAHGGTTTATNGQGLCERCNYAKESPGWRVTTHDANGVHTTEFITPTDARYRSAAPPIYQRIDISEVEDALGIRLIYHHAA
ncbi:HNH endonuclease [Mycobacterium camsae]|uniref:HNH endonuclease n=1 Tax=Mycobacterium gordonae TaxID=1778 RepID=UPI001981950B|nr:HNH endonuclease signature motif containing protein [Mycobacterium gordonae]